MPTQSKTDYIRSLNHLANRYGSLEDRTIRRVQSMLKELRRDVGQQVLTVEGFEVHRLKRLQQSINALIDRFDREAALTINDSLKKSLVLGGKSVTIPMKRVGLKIDEMEEELPFEERPSPVQARIGVGPTVTIAPQQALVAMDYSAELIKSISDEMRARINKQLRLAILGQKKPIEVMRGITNVLGVEARPGIWKKRKDPVKGVAARAETDLRTELQRAYNLAHHAQQKRVQKVASRQGVQVLKGWTATADARTRKAHLDAHRKYSRSPIPIDEPFILYGVGKESGPHKLMYPGDPNGPPGLVINCRCRQYTTTDRIGAIGSSLDGRIAQEHKRRIS